MSINRDELKQKLLARLREAMPDRVWEPDMDGATACLRVPAQHPTVGDLRVWVEDDEVTVGMDLTHTHFDRWSAGRDVAEVRLADEIVEAAVEFIRALLADRVLIEVEYRNGVPGAVSMIHMDSADERDWRGTLHSDGVQRRRFVWSGPFVAGR